MHFSPQMAGRGEGKSLHCTVSHGYLQLAFRGGPTPTAFTSSTHPSAPVMHPRGKGTDNSSFESSRL